MRSGSITFRRSKAFLVLLPVSAALLFGACGGGSSGSGSGSVTPPTAVAGVDQNATVGTPVTLDGGGSTDPQGLPLTYAWQITYAPSGSRVELSDPASATPTFTPDVEGIYIFSLTVNDGEASSDPATTTVSTVWMLNPTGAVSPTLKDPDGSSIPVNVQSVGIVDVGGVQYYEVKSAGIPDYVHTVTQADLDFMDTRPNYATDFRGGTGPSVTLGQQVEWGTDINYASTGDCYQSQGGEGWWPPGPGCPSNQDYDSFFTTAPAPATQICYTALGSIGMYRNGVPIYNWNDGHSYNNADVWHQLASAFEKYDADLCDGHAQMQGAYHHHDLPVCLQEEIGDTGAGHSPIYGYAADGYPVYGPYESDGSTAKSCWKKRDYDTPGSSTGCGTAGARTCLLVDNLDPAAGTVAAPSAGPDTSAIVYSASGNPIPAVSGVYYEDYYFDNACAAQGGDYLDEHNGQDSGDGRGYHYVITADFPNTVGPVFAGELPSNALLACHASPTQ